MHRRPRICPTRYTLADASLRSPNTPPPVLQPSTVDTGVSDVDNAPQHSLPQNLPWSLFNFLRDGTRAIQGKSSLLPDSGHNSVFPTKSAAGGLLGPDSPLNPLKDTSTDSGELSSNEAVNDDANSTQAVFPPHSSWKNWKKMSLDLYIRLMDRPQDTRVRLKQTIALLPALKLKPCIDLGYRGPDTAPVAMRLDIKVLDCLKYRVRADGTSSLQVRARAPLADPRFLVDVVYERDLTAHVDGVKISFRALDVAFLKAPGAGAGVKLPIRFANGIKSTMRVKKFLVEEHAPGPAQGRRVLVKGRRRQPTSRQTVNNSAPNGWFAAPGAVVQQVGQQVGRGTSKFRVRGPVGVDVKLRCLEYR